MARHQQASAVQATASKMQAFDGYITSISIKKMDSDAGASSYVLDDDGCGAAFEVDVDLTEVSGENTSSRASSAPMSRPVTRGSNGTRPQSSGSIFVDDDASENGWGDSNASELSVPVKRLIAAAKDRSASSSSHNMDVIMELYEKTKISTAEAQRNPNCKCSHATLYALNLLFLFTHDRTRSQGDPHVLRGTAVSTINCETSFECTARIVCLLCSAPRYIRNGQDQPALF